MGMSDDEFSKEFDKTVRMLKKLNPEQVQQVLSKVLEQVFMKELAIDEGIIARMIKEMIKHGKKL